MSLSKPIELMRAKDVAGMLGVTETAVRNLVYRRAIPHVKLGKSLRFIREDVENWILDNRIEAA